jgi:hypothetical protein
LLQGCNACGRGRTVQVPHKGQEWASALHCCKSNKTASIVLSAS